MAVLTRIEYCALVMFILLWRMTYVRDNMSIFVETQRNLPPALLQAVNTQTAMEE